MQQLFRRLWYRWIASAFVTGALVLLPVVVTVMIMGWVGAQLVHLIGPQTLIGGVLRDVGLQLVTDPTIATLIGWMLVLLTIWTLGLFIQSTARHQFDTMFHTVMHRIPLMGTIYKPVAHVVGLLTREAQEDLQGMSVVFCALGEGRGAGCLGLLASSEAFRIGEQDCLLIYIPTAPVPMTGGLVFVPAPAVTKVAMSVDDLMKLYFSLGTLAPQVIPAQYHTSKAATGARPETLEERQPVLSWTPGLEKSG
jgi:uncharacterized membrane protein